MHHGWLKTIQPVRRLSWGDGHETSSSTWDPRVDRPTGRSHTFSWNNSETSDRGSGSNGSVAAWRVHGKSIANKSTCPSLLHEAAYTRLSYSRELDLVHKTANRVGWDISHTSIPFEILAPPNARHGKGIPECPPHWEGLGHTVQCIQAGMSGGTPCYSILSSYLPPPLGCLPPLRAPLDHRSHSLSFSSSPQDGRLAFSSDPQTSCSRLFFTPTAQAFFIPSTLGSHWSAFHDPIRTSCLLIGQLFPIQRRTSCLPIGQLALFKRLPWSLDRHSQSNAPQHRHDRRTRSRRLGTSNWSWPCGVHRGSQRHR